MAGEKRFVNGYDCPHCSFKANGLAHPPVDGRRPGWSFNTPVTETLRVECESCGKDVPKEFWVLST
jgi:hypothetical protein